MIKRRFYRVDHGDNDGDDDDSSSSSSSDSDAEAQSSDDSDAEPQQHPEPQAGSDAETDEAEDDDDDNERPSLKPQSPSSSSSGYESEDSSLNEIDAESADLLNSDDDSGGERDGERPNGKAVETLAKDHPATDDVPICVLKSKSVYKCRLCPKIVCLNEESLKTHLKSKRHARSEKLLKNGRLKRALNSDGEEEVFSDDDGETHAERHARIVALAQSTPKTSKGRQRQKNRLKRKKEKNPSDVQNTGHQTENRAKRREKLQKGKNLSNIQNTGQQTENRARRRKKLQKEKNPSDAQHTGQQTENRAKRRKKVE